MSATADLDSEFNEAGVATAVEKVCAEPWYWFPVRHHSAAVARHLEDAILERKPKIVFIEGPAEASDLIPHLVNRKTRPPVAIYSCFQDDSNQFGLAGIVSPSEEIAPRWACWYPFVEYSPELVAIRAATKIGASVHFMDLPHFARLGVESQSEAAAKDSPPVDDDEGSVDDDDAADEEPAGTGQDQAETRNWQTERLIAESEFYQALARAGGYKTWDEGWDALFECRTFENRETFRRELLAFCAAARATSSPERIAMDGTLERERFMLKTIREQVTKEKIDAQDVMIVCGGFHVFLDRDDDKPPPEIPEGSIYTTLVPYTYFRMSNLSGYGAGNRAPQFYQLQWEAACGKVANPKAQYIVSVLQAARKQGERLSSADAISISQHARMLAALRGRSEAILDDLHDALVTCCCKGDPNEQGLRLQQAIDRVDIGTRVGSVADGVPRLPLVADFYDQLARLEKSSLAEREQTEKIELDKRKPEDFLTAAFFHRMRFIKVPFAELLGNPDTDFASGLIFRERWQTRWSPNVEAKLIEQNLLGDTVESAAINQMKKSIVDNEGNAGDICESLVKAMQMNLPDLVEQVFDLAVRAIDEDARFVSLARAVAQLAVLDRYAIHHEMKREQIAAMADRSFARACFAMLDIIAAPDDQHAEIVHGFTILADVVLKGDDESKRSMFAQYVTAALQATQLPMLSGALLGLTVEIQVNPSHVITDEIQGFARSPQEQMLGAGDFIHGVISVSRASIMAGASELVDAMDELLRAAEWEVFMTMLPRIRAGMELLHARHRDSLATRVAEKYGLSEAKQLQKLQLSLDSATAIVELDRQVAAIMQKWSFAE